jgi:hypothetical protein
MLRRDFLKTSAVLGAGALLSPQIVFGADATDSIQFNSSLMEQYDSQSIVIFLYGGASELAGNMTNFEQINNLSQNEYPDIEITPNGFWQNAGGDLMEEMLENQTMSIVRTIYRTLDDSRSHGDQQLQNLKGNLDSEKAGIFRNILEVLYKNNQIDANTILPALSVGESAIYDNGDLINNSLLRAVTIDSELNNPYELKYHTKMNDEQYLLMKNLLDQKNKANTTDNNYFSRLKEHYFKRQDLSEFMNQISETQLPVEFPNTTISHSLQSMIKVMTTNKSSKLGFIAHPNGWDDHSSAISQYQNRHRDLIEALYAATGALQALGNKNINIWVMTEFGRNVNLNNSLGWDHGNQFNLMVFGNNPNLNMGKVIGTTKVIQESESRIYTVPADNSIAYEPYSIASSLYHLFGIQNSDLLTGQPIIKELFS